MVVSFSTASADTTSTEYCSSGRLTTRSDSGKAGKPPGAFTAGGLTAERVLALRTRNPINQAITNRLPIMNGDAFRKAPLIIASVTSALRIGNAGRAVGTLGFIVPGTPGLRASGAVRSTGRL